MAEVQKLFIAVAQHAPMREVEEVLAIADKGLENCVHGRRGSRRQVLLMEGETLDELHLEPGTVRENVTTRGIRLGDLSAGHRLRIGEALLEVALPCEPCERMDEIRVGLQHALQGRRGVLCRVMESGFMRRGDGISILGPAVVVHEKGGES